MAEPATTYLDLDAVEAPNVVISFEGQEHPLKQITLSDWIANTKEIQKLTTAGGDLEVEADVILAMIARSFPTLDPDKLRNMPLVKLNKILAFANGNNGTDDVKKEVEAQAKINPLSAPGAAPADISPKAS